MARSLSSSPDSPGSPGSMPSGQSKDEIINMLKRRLDNTEQELAEEKERRIQKRSVTTVMLGRGVRRLVSCFDTLASLVGEADEQGIQEASGIIPPPPQTDKEKAEACRRDRLYMGYQILVKSVAPHIITLRQGSNIQKLRTYLNDLQQGGNSARADDNSRVREELAKWLNNIYRLDGDERLREDDREGRGLQHDVCGKLLTPITVNWDDMEVRDSIRNGTGEDEDLNAVYFLRCLYPPGGVNPEDPLENFLRGPLVLRTYHSIFISPGVEEDWYAMTLTDDDDMQPSSRSSRSRRRSGRKAREGTKGNIAGILKMNGRVTPRSIAYAATLLVFNLTDASIWDESYNKFSFHGFYNFLVDFFEDTTESDADMKAYIRSLLNWWNKQIFPDHVTTATNSRLSYEMLARARARRRAAATAS